MTLETGDKIIVERGGTNYQMEALDLMTLDDNDQIIIARGGVNYKARFEDIKDDLGGGGCEGIPPVPNPDAPVLTPRPGQYVEELGGFCGGSIYDDTTKEKRLIIVAPKEFTQDGTLLYGYKTALQWGEYNVDQKDKVKNSRVDGREITKVLGLDDPDYDYATRPLGFTWCCQDPEGPNAGVYDPTNSTGTGIGGFNDWYIPAAYEGAHALMAMYYNYGNIDTPANQIPVGWPTVDERIGTIGTASWSGTRYFYKATGNPNSGWNNMVPSNTGKSTNANYRAIRTVPFNN